MTTCSADDSYGLLTLRNSTARRFSHVKTTRRLDGARLDGYPHKFNPHNTLTRSVRHDSRSLSTYSIACSTPSLGLT